MARPPAFQGFCIWKWHKEVPCMFPDTKFPRGVPADAAAPADAPEAVQ